MNISVINIRDMVMNGQEEIVSEFIRTFSCQVKRSDGTLISLNPDIEHFLYSSAIQFAKMKTAITYLVIDSDNGALLGYFALTHKSLDIPADGLSRKVKDKIKRFSAIDEHSNTFTVSAFLLAQFGKNYSLNEYERISGNELMRIATDQLIDVQQRIGGTIVYLDCEADANLIDFYEKQGFTLFGERISENDGKRYLQYLKFI